LSLVCIDLDSAAAITRADEFLPPSGMVDGREGKRRSHRWYQARNESIPPDFHSKAEQASPAAVARCGHPGPFKKQFRTTDNVTAIDFIGTGGQAVVPPSLHHSGEAREWDGGTRGEPAVVEFPALWDAVCKLAEAAGCKLPKATTADDSESGWPVAHDQDEAERRYEAALKVSINADGLPRTGHGGDARTYRLLGYGRYGFGLAPERVLRVFCQVVNDPLKAVNDAWDDRELQRKLDKLVKRGPDHRFSLVPRPDTTPPLLWDDARRLASTFPDAHLLRFRGGDAFRHDGQRYVEQPPVTIRDAMRRHSEAAAEEHFANSARQHTAQVTVAQKEIDGLEQQLASLKATAAPDAEVRSTTDELADARKRKRAIKAPLKVAPPVTAAVVSNAAESLRAARALPPRTPFNVYLSCLDCPPRRWLACANGIIDLDGNRLLPHDPDWFSPVMIPVRYDPAAGEPSKFGAFIDRVTCGDEKIAAVLQEVVGACLDPWLRVQFFALLIGEGRNGKSVFLSVLSALLGSENVSAVDWSNLSSGSHRYMAYQLLGKLANLCGDQAFFDAEDTSALKKLTGGDLFTFEAKGKQPVEAVNSAKIIAACNEAPRLRDKTEGVWRRAVLVPFKWKVPAGEADPRLLTAEYWRDELPAVLNWALLGLERLRKRGEFKLPPACSELLKEHRLDSNPARRFLSEHYRESGNHADYVASADLYQAYREWCDDCGIRRDHQLTDNAFGKEVRRVFPTAEPSSKKVGGTAKRVWTGLAKLTGGLSVTGVTADNGSAGGAVTADDLTQRLAAQGGCSGVG
jgi:P4 family phage/plasmid primase-like protien